MLKIICRIIQDFIFPPYCPSCGKLLNFTKDWCDNCVNEICQLEAIQIDEFEYVDEIYALGAYTKGLRQIIHEIKFNNHKALKNKLNPFLKELDKAKFLDEADLVIPIPISKAKRKKRRYNQVDLIFAKELKKRKCNYCDILAKHDDTKPMFALNKKERMENIMEAFYFAKEEYKELVQDKNILIVDDILTTGSTVEVVAKLLKESGAKKITALTLASGAV